MFEGGVFIKKLADLMDDSRHSGAFVAEFFFQMFELGYNQMSFFHSLCCVLFIEMVAYDL